MANAGASFGKESYIITPSKLKSRALTPPSNNLSPSRTSSVPRAHLSLS